MSRYVRQLPRAAGLWDDESLCPALTVDDHQLVKTGLVWRDGSPIMRTPNPMGFGRDREW
jgi:hypothetical protein